MTEHQLKQGGVPLNLCALLRDERRVTLLANLATEKQARLNEQLIERRLGIADAPVDRELARARG